MRDTYYEESAGSARREVEAKKYSIVHVLSVICFVLAGIHGFFCISFLQGVFTDPELSGLGRAIQTVMLLLPLVFLIGGGVLLFFRKRKYNVSYDYILVDDELRVSRVYNGRKRKYLRTFKMDQILKIGFCERDSFKDTLRGVQTKPSYLTPNHEPMENKAFYYFLYSDSIEKRVYIVEARVELLNNLVLAAGRNKLETR